MTHISKYVQSGKHQPELVALIFVNNNAWLDRFDEPIVGADKFSSRVSVVKDEEELVRVAVGPAPHAAALVTTYVDFGVPDDFEEKVLEEEGNCL